MVSIKDSMIPDPIMIAILSHSISNIGMTNINPDVNSCKFHKNILRYPTPF